MGSVPASGKHFRERAEAAHAAPTCCSSPRASGFISSISVAALSAAFLWPAVASAGIMTINFPTDVVPGSPSGNGNAVADGFAISPSSEYTLVNPGSAPPGFIAQGIGWDSDGPANPHYLGSKSALASLFVGDGGTPFSVISATLIAATLDDDFTMTSSKGGVLDIPAHLDGTFSASFAANPSLWTDISWVTFSYFDAGTPTAGLDQLVVSVDEPQTLAMVALSFLAFLGLRRRPVRVRRSR